MADGPWRCSQCGTINEPVANSCRTCGKWPSLFDLEDSVIDESELAEAAEAAEAAPVVTTFEPRTVEVPAFEPPPPATPVPDHMAPEPEVLDDVEDGEEKSPRRRWTSAILPLALLVYLVVSALLNQR